MDEQLRAAIARASSDPSELRSAISPLLGQLSQGFNPLSPEESAEVIRALARALSLEHVFRVADDLERARLNLLEVSGYSILPATNMETGERKWIAVAPGDERGPVDAHPNLRAAIDSITWRPN